MLILSGAICHHADVHSIQMVTGIKVIIGNSYPEVHKMLPKIEDWGQHFTNGGGEFSIMTLTWLSLFCYTSEPNNSTSQQVNNYEKAVTSSVLPFSFLLTPLPSLPLFPPLSVLRIMAPKIQLEGLGSTLSSPSGSGANPYQNWIWCIAAIKYEFWWLQF